MVIFGHLAEWELPIHHWCWGNATLLKLIKLGGGRREVD
jgi:hypothetical protein